jgi:hypothetical protein
MEEAGSGFIRVQGSGFRVQGSRFKVQGSGFNMRRSASLNSEPELRTVNREP